MSIPTPISYWNLLTNSNDAVDGNSGTDTSMSYSSGAVFNGSTSFITKATASGLPVSSANRTMAVWVKTSSATQQQLMSYGTNAGGVKYFGMAYIDEGSGRRFYFTGSGGDIDSTVDIGDGAWHFLVVTYDGTTLKTYVDNVAKGNGALAVATLGTNLFFGGQDSTTWLLTGSERYAGIWGSVLSTADMTALYNAGAGLAFPFPAGPANLKTWMGVTEANIKTIENVAIANIKTVIGLS